MSKCPFSGVDSKKGIKEFLVVLFAFIVVVFFLMVVLALPVMLLWNYLMPEITYGKIKQIDFFQALSLNILCFILFRNKNLEKQNEKL